jgi:hypothetical protein
MSNYDATGGEQGWIMKSKLNELRLDAGIARIENQQWLCVLDKETGMMIDPMIGLEKFAELIVKECAKEAFKYTWNEENYQYYNDNGWDCLPGDLKSHIEEHFGVEE